MENKANYLISLLLCFTSCHTSSVAQSSQKSNSETIKLMEEYINNIINSFICDMEKVYEIYFVNLKKTTFNITIDQIELRFFKHQIVNLDDARKLEMAVVEELANRINTDEKIRPFLREYPFTKKNILIQIDFKNKDDSPIPKDHISSVSNFVDDISYYVYDPSINKYYLFHRESYGQTENILQEKSIENTCYENEQNLSQNRREISIGKVYALNKDVYLYRSSRLEKSLCLSYNIQYGSISDESGIRRMMYDRQIIPFLVQIHSGTPLKISKIKILHSSFLGTHARVLVEVQDKEGNVFIADASEFFSNLLKSGNEHWKIFPNHEFLKEIN